jgi:hypothetical protein
MTKGKHWSGEQEMRETMTDKDRALLQLWRELEGQPTPSPLETGPTTDSPDEPLEPEMAPSTGMLTVPTCFARKFRLLALQLVQWLMPELAIPNYCIYCWTRMELVEHQILQTEGQCAARGVYFWECPNCHDRTSQPYRIARRPDIMW